MTTTQLPLTHPNPTNAPGAPVFLGWADAHPRTPAPAKAQAAIRRFEERYATAPAELHCHPFDAEDIGPECGGVPVIGDGHARHTYLAGPQPMGVA